MLGSLVSPLAHQDNKLPWLPAQTQYCGCWEQRGGGEREERLQLLWAPMGLYSRFGHKDHETSAGPWPAPALQLHLPYVPSTTVPQHACHSPLHSSTTVLARYPWTDARGFHPFPTCPVQQRHRGWLVTAAPTVTSEAIHCPARSEAMGLRTLQHETN